MAFRIIPLLLYLIPLVLATGDFQLHPVRRESFCESYQPIPGSDDLPPCDDGSTKLNRIEVDLRDDEQLIWSSPDVPEAPALSFKMRPYPGQRVLDMERFVDDVVAVTCAEKMSIQFNEESPTFDKARASWDWVNKGNRTFILVGDPNTCGSGNKREPWQVTHAEFDPADHIIRLSATKKEWKDVTYEYSIDFAAVEKTNQTSKRSVLEPTWSEAFEVGLDIRLPEVLTSMKGSDGTGALSAELALNCPGCGFFGSLVFEGHIQGHILEGLKRADLSLKPRNIHAELNLEFVLAGSFDSTKLPDPISNPLSKTFDIMKIPLPASWTVPGVLRLGPYANLQGGIGLKSLAGRAELTTGFSVRIPDSSAIVINFLSDDKVTRNGWIPTFELHPPTLEAEVDATINLFIGLTPSLDLSVVGLGGYGAEFPFKFMDVDLDLETGYNSQGFCPPDTAPAGFRLDTKVGASMSAKLVKTKDGSIPIKVSTPKTSLAKRDETLFEHELFSLKKRPMEPWCKSFGEGAICEVFEPLPEEMEWYEAEIAGADGENLARGRRHVAPRANARELLFGCTGKKFQIKPYPGPTELVKDGLAGDPVPIMLPKATCDEKSCSDSENWYFDAVEDAEVLQASEGNNRQWSTEHVFEANWLPRFWEHMATRPGLDCPKIVEDLKIGVTGGLADSLLGAIGNSATVTRLMTILPLIENGIKHRIFAGTSPESDSKFNSRTTGGKACTIGRIVSVCRLMEMPETMGRLIATIEGVDKVFKDLDKNNYGYAEAHAEWFTDFYRDGIKSARMTIIEFAQRVMNDTKGFSDLPEDTQTQIERMAACDTPEACAEFCPSTFKYPEHPGQPSETDRRVAVVVDSSGSNEQNDPRNLRIEAAKAIVSSLITYAQDARKPDKVAIVDFDSTASVIYPMGDPGKAYFDSIDSIGGTYIGAGLAAATDEIMREQKGPKAENSGIVILTDGEDGDFTYQMQQLQRAKDLNIRVNYGFLSPPAAAAKRSLAKREPSPELIEAILLTGGIYGTIDSAEAQKNFVTLVLAHGLTAGNSSSSALTLVPGVAVSDILLPKDEEKVYQYTAAKGEEVTLTLVNKTPKWNLEGVLRDGTTELAIIDANAAENFFTFKASKTTTLVLSVSSPDENRSENIIFSVILEINRPPDNPTNSTTSGASSSTTVASSSTTETSSPTKDSSSSTAEASSSTTVASSSTTGAGTETTKTIIHIDSAEMSRSVASASNQPVVTVITSIYTTICSTAVETTVVDGTGTSILTVYPITTWTELITVTLPCSRCSHHPQTSQAAGSGSEDCTTCGASNDDASRTRYDGQDCPGSKCSGGDSTKERYPEGTNLPCSGEGCDKEDDATSYSAGTVVFAPSQANSAATGSPPSQANPTATGSLPSQANPTATGSLPSQANPTATGSPRSQTSEVPVYTPPVVVAAASRILVSTAFLGIGVLVASVYLGWVLIEL